VLDELLKIATQYLNPWCQSILPARCFQKCRVPKRSISPSCW